MKDNGNYVEYSVCDIIFKNACGVLKIDTLGKIIREKTESGEVILIRHAFVNDELEKILNYGSFSITLISGKFNCCAELIGKNTEVLKNMRLVKKFTTRTSKPSDTDVCYVFAGNDNYNYKDIDRIIQRDNNEQLIRAIRDIHVNIDTYNIVKSLDTIANNLKDINKKLSN